jgi:hypothetical protein
MTAQTAIRERFQPRWPGMKLPKRLPPFNTATYRIFSAIWIAALLLAVFGPTLALYDRYTSPGDNSQLMLGARAGFAVAPQDATKIRFTVGPEARAAGLRKGDDIVAIYGLPLPDKMPVTEQVLAQRADDPAYIAMGNLLYGTESLPFPLTVHSTNGKVHEVTVTTSEDHIRAASSEHGVAPVLLSFIDVVHVIFYPFLIWAAWILHRRNSRDAISSILSLAILLMIGSELPASNFLSSIGVPRPVHVAMYDIGNVLLIAGILLFPHGNLSPRLAALVGVSPLLLALSGRLYEAYFLMLLIIAVLIQIRCLRTTEAQDLKQQIRWALFGFTGYATFKAISYLADVFKYSTGSFGGQLGFELTAGLSFGLSMLVFQLGLLVALIRYRLYDAEAIISRTATAAILTFAIGGTFAAVMEGIITGLQFLYPESEASQTIAAMGGAVVAAVFIEPVNRKTHAWVERRFHKALLEIREKVPELMRDTRDSATLDDFLEGVLERLVTGVLAVRGAVILEGQVRQTVGIADTEVLRWHEEAKPEFDHNVLDCIPGDHVFPLRLEVEISTGAFGWLLIGPRPDGTIPGEDEQEELEKIAHTLGRSIRIVLSREQDREEMLRLVRTQSERIDRIEQLLKLQRQ